MWQGLPFAKLFSRRTPLQVKATEHQRQQKQQISVTLTGKDDKLICRIEAKVSGIASCCGINMCMQNRTRREYVKQATKEKLVKK